MTWREVYRVDGFLLVEVQATTVRLSEPRDDDDDPPPRLFVTRDELAAALAAVDAAPL